MKKQLLKMRIFSGGLCHREVLTMLFMLILLCPAIGFNQACHAAEQVKIGFNYPKTGPYAANGLDQQRGAELALEEINAAGGILGREAALVSMDGESRSKRSVANVQKMIEEGVTMVFGGVTSSVAASVSDLCQQREMLYMVPVAGSPALTGENAHRFTFRLGYNSVNNVRALAYFLNEHYPDKTFFYVTFDHPMGTGIETYLRKLTDTEDSKRHKSVRTPFPIAHENNYVQALETARKAGPDVLVLIQLGKYVSMSILQSAILGLKDEMQVVVPFLELNNAEGIPPRALEGIIGTTDWAWEVPYAYNYPAGKAFVERFTTKYKRYPSWGAMTAYTILYEYKSAVERAQSFEIPAVIEALEGHEFTLLKNMEKWRAFDHQCVQSVYIAKGKSPQEVLADPFKLDYFQIIGSAPGVHTTRSIGEWEQVRKHAGKPIQLEPLLQK